MRLVMICAFLATPAIAQQQDCIPSLTAYDALTNGYNEERLQALVMPDGRIVETWGNRDTETWSLMITDPSGVSCPLGSGIGLEIFQAKPNV